VQLSRWQPVYLEIPNAYPNTHPAMIGTVLVTISSMTQGLEENNPFPLPSMYGIFTYIWLFFMVNVGKYTIHGSYGFVDP